MCVPDKTLVGSTLTPYSQGQLSQTQTYMPSGQFTLTTQQQKKQAGFQDVIAPQLGLPAAPPLFAPKIERAAGTGTQYTTDADGVKRPVKTGYQSLQITRQ